VLAVWSAVYAEWCPWPPYCAFFGLASLDAISYIWSKAFSDHAKSQVRAVLACQPLLVHQSTSSTPASPAITFEAGYCGFGAR